MARPRGTLDNESKALSRVRLEISIVMFEHVNLTLARHMVSANFADRR
jgi:hypothetical protein